MRTRIAAGLLLLALDATLVFAQQSGTPPRAPKPLPAPSPATPAPAPKPAARPDPAVSPWDDFVWAAKADAMAAARSIDVDAIKAQVMTSVAPRALADMQGKLAQTISIDAAMAGQRAAMAGMQAAMDGQRAAIEAQVATTINGSFGQGFSYAPFASGSARSQAPAPWKSDDPADSLYREARKALSNDAYQRAVELFQRIRNDFAKSVYAPDAGYWQAFALQRMGGDGNLRAAMQLLEQQQEKFPRAATRGDAQTLRTRIEGQLARLGDQQAIASLADKARNASSDGCPREQDDERIDALNAVAQIDADKAMPILKKVLARREPCTQKLRRAAVWLVASKKQADAADVLLNVAKTDPDKDVREQAVFWMSNVPTEEATTMLIDLAKKGDDLDLRKRAVYSLSRSKSPRAATTIKEIALDANAEVDLRGDALNYYMSGPGRTAEDAMSFLKDVYGRADDQRFKQRVLQVIASRRNDESRAFLIELAQNSKETMELRRSAIWTLQGSGVTNAQLAQIYDRGTDTEVRKQVIGVLGSLRDNAGVEKLLEIGRNEKNPELRKTAITYLSRSKDPRVIELLAEIINK